MIKCDEIEEKFKLRIQEIHGMKDTLTQSWLVEEFCIQHPEYKAAHSKIEALKRLLVMVERLLE